MNLIDLLDVYSALHDSDDLFFMLSDYPLDVRISRDTMNTVIIDELGATKPITTDPEMFKILLDTFFKKYNLNIQKLVDTMYLEYNPLDTKNVTEVEHRFSTGDIDNTDKYDTTSGQEDKVSAYDTSVYQPKGKTDGTTHHEGETTSDIESTVDTDKTIRGKDGQDSFQTLIEQERKLAEFNIFNWITKQMRKELFLMVY
jgi:hypothetical protein